MNTTFYKLHYNKLLRTIIANWFNRDFVIGKSVIEIGLQLTQTIRVPLQNPVTASRWLNRLVVLTKSN